MLETRTNLQKLTCSECSRVTKTSLKSHQKCHIIKLWTSFNTTRGEKVLMG